MAEVTLINIAKVYDKDVVAVEDFCLEIADKEFVVLVGPSGCGKSTTLRMIAGLEQITSGQLYIGDKLVNDVAPKERDISMVFQNYALYPHMTVYENIAFPLKMRKLPKSEIDKKVRQAAEILEITELLKRKPKALSGGQRQRVAIGRAIVREPKVFLMDEPLSNLDAKLRNQMRTELIKLRRRINTTFVYVTHDQTEAMTLGDRIVVMNGARIMQAGTPREVFDEPANIFVAGFIGTPQMNFIDARLQVTPASVSLFVGEFPVVLSDDIQKRLREGGAVSGPVTLGVRPENFHLTQQGGIPARADVSELMGSTTNLHAYIGDTEVVAVVSAAACQIGPADASKTVAPGTQIYLLPDLTNLHLFHPETGESLLRKAAAPPQDQQELLRILAEEKSAQ